MTLLAPNESLENKISFYHLVLFLLLLPFDRFYSELVAISFFLHAVIHLRRSNLKKIVSRQILVLCSAFLLTLTGLAWSSYVSNGLKDMEHQLVIVLFPMAFTVINLNLSYYKLKLMMIFAAGCVATIVYLYVDAIRIIIYYGLPARELLSQSFINHNFSAPIAIHATYLSMYVALSIATLFYTFIQTKRKFNRLILWVGIIILFAGLLQLASKSVLAASLLFIAAGFIFLLHGKLQKKIAVIAGLAVVVIATLAITTVKPLKERYVAAMAEDMGKANVSNTIIEPRMARWESALPLMANRPFYGYGSGAEKEILKEEYFKNKLYNSYLHELDIHNQFLSFAIKYGIPGTAIFLFTLFIGFATAYRNKDALFICFMILISTVSLSENILDVNKGIFFYAFFFSLFMITGRRNKAA